MITFDSDHWKKVLTNLTIFFDSCVAPYRLGYKILQFCPICDKLYLPQEEVDKESDKSSFCTSCEQAYHITCLGTEDIQAHFICSGCENS